MKTEEIEQQIELIWSTPDVREASDRCDRILELAEWSIAAAVDYDEELQWLTIRRRAIQEFNDHCPVFLNG